MKGALGMSGVLSGVEAPWVLSAALWVNLSYMLLLPPAAAWVGVVAAAVPFLFRLGYRGYAGIRTPFDLPVGVMVAGGLLGYAVSPVKETSLGALQSLLAATFSYYAIANCSRPGRFLKLALPLAGVMLLLAMAAVFRQGPLPPGTADRFNVWAFDLADRLPGLPVSPRYPHLVLGTSHGLALTLAIAVALGAGMAIFSSPGRLRRLYGMSSLLLFGGLILFTSGALWRLFTLQSIRTRLWLWEDAWELLGDSPLTGVGLGSWAYLHNKGGVSFYGTHPHNAYLQLFSDTGFLGALAGLLALGIAWRLARDILRAPPGGWKGFGVGVLLACALTLVVAFLETAPVGVPMAGKEGYLYVVSPLPWLLSSFLVLAHRGVKGKPNQADGSETG